MLLTAGLLATACSSSSPTEPEGTLPSWLDTLIANVEAEPVTNPPTSFWSYDYQGQQVYYRPPRCCDIFSVLYDESGTVLCHPDGGVAGQGDGGCTDFIDTRTNGELVWEDPRG